MKKDQARALLRQIDADPDRYLTIAFCGLRHIPAEVDPVWGKYPEEYGVFIAADYWEDTIYDYREARAVLADLR